MEPEKKTVPPARIVLPTRSPVAPVHRMPPKIMPAVVAEQLGEPFVVAPLATENVPFPAEDRTPAKATAPLPAIVQTSRPASQVEPISRALCWSLLAISAVIFLIQIWNYVVS